MAYPESFLEELRARARLSDIVGRRVRLTRKGREYSGLCPFHNEKTPSFTLNDDKAFYHCFGCGAHGSVFDFVMRMDNVGFVDAVSRLADEVGLTPPQASPEVVAREQRRRSLFDVLDAAAVYYEKTLRMPEGREALDYLRRRGLSDDTIAQFRLGYAPNTRSAIKGALGRADIAEHAMIETGLLIAPDDLGRTPYDRFRGRVMFPIADRRGRIVGFGGRIIGAGEPKYLNSPETSLFHKGRILYGLSEASKACRDAGTIIVVEGYMDVIGLNQAGYKNVVAPLGTALTEDQLKELWHTAPEPTLWFDPDPAGVRAAVRAAEAALPLLQSGVSLKFAFSRLDTRDDPADLARRYDRQFVDRTLTDSIALSELIFRVARQDRRLRTAEDRAGLEERLDRQTARISDQRMRRHYRALFRDRLYGELRKQGNNRKRADEPHHNPVSTPQRVPSLRSNAERHLIELILLYPDLFQEVEESFGRILFHDTAYDALRQDMISVLSGGEHDLTASDLRDRLLSGSQGETAEAILSHPAACRLAPPSQTVDREDIRDRWREAMDVIRAEQMKAELATDDSVELALRTWQHRSQLIEATLRQNNE